MAAPAWIREAVYRGLLAVSGNGRGIRIILLYHSIGRSLPVALPVEEFEDQMRLLVERFTVVRLGDLLDRTAVGSTENLAVVTFDDGYADNYELAAPVLRRLRIPGTFFVVTGYLGARFPTSWGSSPLMTPQQVQTLAEDGHEIGGHTVTHPRLTEVPADVAEDEVRRGKHELESLLGAPVSSFAYPKGSVSPRVRNTVAAAGYRCAVTTRRGLVDPPIDWLDLPRVAVGRGVSPTVFRGLTSPATRWLARVFR